MNALEKLRYEAIARGATTAKDDRDAEEWLRRDNENSLLREDEGVCFSTWRTKRTCATTGNLTGIKCVASRMRVRSGPTALL